MIPIPSGVRVWIATGHTDMRRGMQSLALTVQENLKHDPHAGDLYIFRGRRGDLAKILWHDGLGMSLYAKRLHLAFGIGWFGIDLCRPDGLYARGHRLEKSATNLATCERGLSKKFAVAGMLGESQRIQSVIHCFAWMLSAKRFRMMSLP